MFLSPSSFRFRLGLLSWTSLIIAFLCISTRVSIAQSSAEIQSNQKKLKAEIALTQSNLKKLNVDKSVGLARYNTLRKQLKSRIALIKNAEIELDQIDADLVAQQADITLLKVQYDAQRERYKTSVRDYQKVRTSFHPLAFIFSSADLMTAWKRMTFYQRLSRYHRTQVSKLKRKEDELRINLNELKGLQADKQQTLSDIQSQKTKIAQDQKSKKAGLDRLKKNEGWLTKRLKAQERQATKLATMLTQLVEASINKSTNGLPVETKRLNNAFGANKGKLPWPVAKGYVGKKFGKQRHPDLKMILINNNGIDIITQEGTEVLSVFDGKVVAIQTVAGFNQTILLNHGSYYTVYANVDNVAVSTGEQVKRGQTLAYASSSDDGASIHFELWNGKTLQNPSLWLRKK